MVPQDYKSDGRIVLEWPVFDGDFIGGKVLLLLLLQSDCIEALAIDKR